MTLLPPGVKVHLALSYIYDLIAVLPWCCPAFVLVNGLKTEQNFSFKIKELLARCDRR